MISLEQEVKIYLKDNKYRYSDSTGSMTNPDFGILLGDKIFQLEVKEKQQKYNCLNWNISEENEFYTFILDDLSARKISKNSPSALLVRNVDNIYTIFTDLDLLLMPKKRVNRRISKSIDTLKGKWLIDIRCGVQAKNLDYVLSFIKSYQRDRSSLYLEGTACYGDYPNEYVGIAGSIRTGGYWKQDLESTR